jgi:hypothetical protein
MECGHLPRDHPSWHLQSYRTEEDFTVGQEVPVVLDGHDVGRIPVADHFL